MTSLPTKITSLRQHMIDAMLLRGFSERTHESYLAAVYKLAKYYHRPPDRISCDEIQGYFLYLAKERKLSGASCRLYLNGIRFFYLEVLHWSAFEVEVQVPKKEQRIPELLTHREVGAIIAHCTNLKHKMMLLTCYGCGLRVSELVSIKVRHIDGERHLLRVEQGKGAKDRYVQISETLLQEMRRYWRHERPDQWFFPGAVWNRPLCLTSAQKVFVNAKRKAGIEKIGGIHSLRHAYATHQLEAGLPVHQLQRQLGHRNIQSTLRYVHWAPVHQEQKGHCDLIAALEVDHG